MKVSSCGGANRPIGVFDSGIGGLSVLAALRAELPHERFVYFADTGYAPYGERGDAYVIERSRTVTRWLADAHDAKALVVACNTATAAAIGQLRTDHPALAMVGVEPALKPAAQASRTREVGVVATRGTLESQKFQALRGSLGHLARFHAMACDGLAAAIEHHDTADITALCARYMGALGPWGTGPGQIDTLVLGCTHYPFVAQELRRHTGPEVRFFDTGVPVAQQTRRLLAASGQLRSGAGDGGGVELLTSGAPEALQAAVMRWLSLDARVASVSPMACTRPAP